eukprot:157645-Prorocentrum_lima.AAC.1
METPAAWPIAPRGTEGSACDTLLRTLRAIAQRGMANGYRRSGILPPLFWLAVEPTATGRRS